MSDIAPGPADHQVAINVTHFTVKRLLILLNFVNQPFNQTGGPGRSLTSAQVFADSQRNEEDKGQVNSSTGRQRIEGAEADGLSSFGQWTSVGEEFVTLWLVINPIKTCTYNGIYYCNWCRYYLKSRRLKKNEPLVWDWVESIKRTNRVETTR